MGGGGSGVCCLLLLPGRGDQLGCGFGTVQEMVTYLLPAGRCEFDAMVRDGLVDVSVF